MAHRETGELPEADCQHCRSERGQDGTLYHQPPCPTLTEPHAIVRELAERGPFTDGEWNQQCVFCEVVFNVHSGGTMENPANHEPSCLWRRAKALHPGEPEQ